MLPGGERACPSGGTVVVSTKFHQQAASAEEAALLCTVVALPFMSCTLFFCFFCCHCCHLHSPVLFSLLILIIGVLIAFFPWILLCHVSRNSSGDVVLISMWTCVIGCCSALLLDEMKMSGLMQILVFLLEACKNLLRELAVRTQGHSQGHTTLLGRDTHTHIHSQTDQRWQKMEGRRNEQAKTNKGRQEGRGRAGGIIHMHRKGKG